MPRRNHRDTAVPPLDLTREDPPLLRPSGSANRPGPRPFWAPAYESPVAQRERERSERQAKAREQGGIDWSCCLVPGCGRELAQWADGARRREYMRDPETLLPVCTQHAVIVWQNVQRFRMLPDVVETAEQMSARHRREAARSRPKRLKPDDDGELYFVRVNDLVKVGWTATLERRLKEYGAGAELLCHYPGTRRRDPAASSPRRGPCQGP
jgi:hypothetical protein